MGERFKIPKPLMSQEVLLQQKQKEVRVEHHLENLIAELYEIFDSREIQIFLDLYKDFVPSEDGGETVLSNIPGLEEDEKKEFIEVLLEHNIVKKLGPNENGLVGFVWLVDTDLYNKLWTKMMALDTSYNLAELKDNKMVQKIVLKTFARRFPQGTKCRETGKHSRSFHETLLNELGWENMESRSFLAFWRGLVDAGYVEILPKYDMNREKKDYYFITEKGKDFIL